MSRLRTLLWGTSVHELRKLSLNRNMSKFSTSSSCLESDKPCLESEKPTEEGDEEPVAKRQKVVSSEHGSEESGEECVNPGEDRGADAKFHKRKCALLISFCGKDYKGMQRNPGVDTIEEDLIQALYKASAINEQMRDNLGKLKFQRCARTDKGVSAARQLVSLKMVPKASMISAVNSHLPPQIRVMKLFRTTRSFNSKDWCNSRTYEYFLPTYAFCSDLKVMSRKFRISQEVITTVDSVLQKYCGTHNFHNFTSGKQPHDPSCKRYIMSFQCGTPTLLDDTEYINVMIKGQSFMLHQIRKMIGLMLAVVRGYIGEDIISKSFEREKIDIPRAPGLYLILDNIHFDRYNRKFGQDGMHEQLDWLSCEEEIGDFKCKHIYRVIHEAELDCSPMTEWLATLNVHLFFDTVSVPQLPPGAPHQSEEVD